MLQSSRTERKDCSFRGCIVCWNGTEQFSGPVFRLASGSRILRAAFLSNDATSRRLAIVEIPGDSERSRISVEHMVGCY
jgi:hypothetical protein